MSDTTAILAQVKDIHEPPAPEGGSVASLTLLGTLLLIVSLMLIGLIHQRQRQRHNATAQHSPSDGSNSDWSARLTCIIDEIQTLSPQRGAQAASLMSGSDTKETEQKAAAVAQIARLLREYAQSHARRVKDITAASAPTDTAQIASLNGIPWLTHLDQLFNTRFFTQQEGRVFGNDRFHTSSRNLKRLNTDQLINLCHTLNRMIRRSERLNLTRLSAQPELKARSPTRERHHANNADGVDA